MRSLLGRGKGRRTDSLSEKKARGEELNRFQRGRKDSIYRKRGRREEERGGKKARELLRQEERKGAERSRKDSYKGIEDRGKKRGKGTEGEGGEGKDTRPSIRLHSPSDLRRRGKSSMSRARRQRALPSRVNHGHVPAGAETGRKRSGQASMGKKGKDLRLTFLLSCGIWNCWTRSG